VLTKDALEFSPYGPSVRGVDVDVDSAFGALTWFDEQLDRVV